MSSALREIEEVLREIWEPKPPAPAPRPPASLAEITRLVALARAYRRLADDLASEAGRLMVAADRNEQNAPRV